MLAFLPVLISLFAIFIIVQYLVRRERKRNKFSPFTEPFLRSPGYSLNQQLDDLQVELFATVTFIAVPPFYFVIAISQGLTSKVFLPSVLVLAIMTISMFKLMKLYQKIQPIKLGYHGELYTGQELNYLMRHGAFVYHDIPYKYGNIDHLIVSQGGVFVVETKAVRKPMDEHGKKTAKMSINNGVLVFPHARTSQPLKQVGLHAQWLRKKLMVDVPVSPIVALPGWYIKGNNQVGEVLVINPKRGKFLQSLVKRELISEKDFDIIVRQVEELARDVDHHKSVTDSDANRSYTAMLNKK